MLNRPSTHQYQGASAPRSHTARVVEDLGLAIVSGRQQQGSLLPGDIELIERYGVSRTVLREALKTLAAKGLVQAKARIGTRVREQADWNFFDAEVLIWHARAGFTTEFLAHLGEMRLALEPEAAALAAARRSPQQLEAMWGWHGRMAVPRIPPADFVLADLGLHLAIADAAGNPFFLSISTLIEVALVQMLTVSSPAEDTEQLTESVGQHRAIVEAIDVGNVEAARAAMRVVVKRGVDLATRAPTPGPDRAALPSAPA